MNQVACSNQAMTCPSVPFPKGGIFSEACTKYIQNNYRNIETISDTTKQILLDQLNSNFKVNFSFDDVWGQSRTTIPNKFGYFGNHFGVIPGIIYDRQYKTIDIDQSKMNEIKKVLSLNKS